MIQCATMTAPHTSPLSGAIAARRAILAFPGAGLWQQPTQRLLNPEAARLHHRSALARHAVAACAVGVAVQNFLDLERVLGRIHHVTAAQVGCELVGANLALWRRDIRELVR